MLFAIEDAIHFRMVRKIAAGGMGTVYEARELGVQGFEKRVAVKMLLPEYSDNARFVQLFIAEAKLVADLVHENIVQIYQLGRDPERGYYIVMEYVHGLSLGEFIDFHAVSDLSVPPELAVFIVSRIARGLAYAHSRLDAAGKPLHIVHRDVCPNNILVTTEGLPKLTDFGIAKAANQVIPFWGGKAAYMAPEQARREEIDFRSDIYALGLVLFELLALSPARAPWRDSSLEAAQDGLVAFDALPETLEAGLLDILDRMLAAEPERRYADTASLARDLEYHIYRTGYGPTVVTLEEYLRRHFPYLHIPERAARQAAREMELVRTVVLNREDRNSGAAEKENSVS